MCEETNLCIIHSLIQTGYVTKLKKLSSWLSYHQFDLRGIAVSILIGYKLNYLKPCMFIL
jgi:hypothetical protein